MTEWAIETAGLRKMFGQKEAVADLTLQVPRGEVFGFLGPNGAGKSTAVKMLLGLVTPTSGAVRVLGRRPGDARALSRVGFLPEHFRFHEWLQAAELLDLHARLYGMSAVSRRRRIPEVLETVGLADQAGKQLSGFSKGMLQRVGLAQALLATPDLVVLDEPTSALDPFGRMLVRGVIRELRDQGATVFLNSHLLSEVEATCDRVAFLREGRVLRTLRLDDTEAVRLTVDLEIDALNEELSAALDDIAVTWRCIDPDGRIEHKSRTRIELTVADEDVLPRIAARAVASGAKVYRLTPRKVSLEELFLEVVGRQDSGQ